MGQNISPYKRKFRSWTFDCSEEEEKQKKDNKDEESNKTLQLFPLHPEGLVRSWISTTIMSKCLNFKKLKSTTQINILFLMVVYMIFLLHLFWFSTITICMSRSIIHLSVFVLQVIFDLSRLLFKSLEL